MRWPVTLWCDRAAAPRVHAPLSGAHVLLCGVRGSPGASGPLVAAWQIIGLVQGAIPCDIACTQSLCAHERRFSLHAAERCAAHSANGWNSCAAPSSAWRVRGLCDRGTVFYPASPLDVPAIGDV